VRKVRVRGEKRLARPISLCAGTHLSHSSTVHSTGSLYNITLGPNSVREEHPVGTEIGIQICFFPPLKIVVVLESDENLVTTTVGVNSKAITIDVQVSSCGRSERR